MIDFDFLPPEYHVARAERSSVRRYVVLGGVLLAAMGAWFGMHQHRLHRVRSLLGELQQQRCQIAIHRARLDTLQSRREELVERRRLAEFLEDAASLPVVLAEVSRQMPVGVCLTEIDYRAAFAAPLPSPQRPHAPQLPPPLSPTTRPSSDPRDPARRPYLELHGLAADPSRIGDLAAALAGSRLFADVSTQGRPDARAAGRRGPGFSMNCRVLVESGGAR